MTAKRDKRDDVALYHAIEEQKLNDDVAEIEAMSDAELDAIIADNGGDPKEIRESGRALAERLLGKRLAWQGEMAEKLEAFRTEAAAQCSGPRLPRPELLARLAAARKDPRFATPVAMLFQKKTPEASTDDELQALIDAIDLLAKLERA
jgi:hypothetical protein